jgi:hypothetical protein
LDWWKALPCGENRWIFNIAGGTCQIHPFLPVFDSPHLPPVACIWAAPGLPYMITFSRNRAAVNWISLMGRSFDDHTEFFKLAYLVENFSLTRLNSSPAAINFTKLDHFNGLNIRSLPVAEFSRRIKPFFESAGLKPDDSTLLKIALIIQEWVATLDESSEIAGFFFRSPVEPKVEDFIAKGLTASQSIDVAWRTAWQFWKRQLI